MKPLFKNALKDKCSSLKTGDINQLSNVLVAGYSF